ncbi:retinoic acid receptor responder protein 2 isoform X3 [Ahaetulla prasina]|uniref:retinoic acid receptor responder protein 2 isoform X3 n=1 Tax=Ahaetulla prasina TaxID=499056 RepID=UPI002648CF75|nr:retinoic acid receptor responder protein 2 isoform X3 [Ahaetulla prasina]
MTHPSRQLQGRGRRSASGPAQKFTMSRWLLSCMLLVLIEVGRPTALQNALEKVLEDFHGRNLVQAAFRGEMAEEVMEVLPKGTYVQLEVNLVQTICRKHQWRSQNCQVKAGGEVRRRQEEECRAIKLANEDPYLPGKFAFSVGLPS